ncbi:hypothetical protein BVE84_04140 [Streptococcus azizii]|uniref:Uncharacterized protein n=1 Tax=Streptococcus azizii TaxID=1579424 RepID=A0AB36JRW9_9STRE|nr:hypothetical protein BVE86_05225 [Streptococcus azizii]ONK27698.1 hypothetical protein BVE85_05920 [Streptococcus azizii]ONK29877.1 hypothetical protein BVE84_04140 [Streptococcus azizii]
MEKVGKLLILFKNQKDTLSISYFSIAFYTPFVSCVLSISCRKIANSECDSYLETTLKNTDIAVFLRVVYFLAKEKDGRR